MLAAAAALALSFSVVGAVTESSGPHADHPEGVGP